MFYKLLLPCFTDWRLLYEIEIRPKIFPKFVVLLRKYLQQIYSDILKFAIIILTFFALSYYFPTLEDKSLSDEDYLVTHLPQY